LEEDAMKKDFNGLGKIFQDKKQICSGSYNIHKVSGPDTHIRQSGTFKVSGMAPSELTDIFGLLQSSPDLILVIEDRREFNINLSQINLDFESGSAQFKILFMPNNTEI
jgi:hypothetical protein